MNTNEYFSNTYKSIISNKFIHLIIILLEYLFTLTVQIIIFITQFNSEYKYNFTSLHFHLIMIKIINSIPLMIKILIIIIIYISIIIYYLIYNRFSFQHKYIINIVIINVFEIFIFRLFFIIICHVVFSLNGIPLFICILLSIPVISKIINNFYMNHLYYYSPHFIIYPYDYYSSFTDIFHLVEKIFISISLQSSINDLNEFLFITSFLLQLISFIFSIYIFIYKSYYIMSNIFLNKARFSFLLSTILVNLLMIVLGKNNLKGTSFLIILINIYFIFFIIIQIFYDPYKYAFFSTDESIENLYFYFYIIDHHKNESFMLEEKLEKHCSLCKNCELCNKLKKYLLNKVNYKNIYKILYKDIGILSKIMNELVHSLLIHGKQYIKNNSYYLINFIYCYYYHFNKKNFILCSNLKIIYEIINEESKNILENHLLSSEQILLINEFLFKANQALEEIKKVVLEKFMKNKINKFFSLFKIIFELNDKKFKSKLYFNKNEGIINFGRYISICTMIYEEIFNINLSINGIYLRENQIFLDELSNKNNNETNQIIIQLDLLNFENKIIYIIGEFAKYKNKALCKLFPNIFRNKQLLIIKKKILNSKYYQSGLNEEEQKDLFNINKDIKKQYIDFQCVIYDTIDNKKIFKMIYLRLYLIYPLKLKKKILLAGIYSIENNIVITLDKTINGKNKEIILNEENENDINNSNLSIKNNILIKYKKNDKYYKNKKLIFINKYFINPNIYNIYYISSPEKKKTYKEDIKVYENSIKNLILFEDSKMKNGSEANQLNFLIQSTSTSTFSKISNDRKNFKKRNKNSKKDNKKKNFFKLYQFGLIIFSVIIFLCQILFHLLINNNINNIGNQNNALMTFKSYYGIFNILLTSIFSVICLASESSGDKCTSIIGLFENYYNSLTNKDNLNLTEFFSNQNKYLSNEISKVKQNITTILTNSDDQELISLVNSKIPIYYINQYFYQNKIQIKYSIQNNTFLEVLDYMTNGFIIMSNYRYINETVYILNKISNSNISPFIHIKSNKLLTQYQINYYFFVSNFQSFIQTLDIINLKLIIKTSTLGSSSITLSIIYIVISLILYLLIHIILFIYIRNYYIIIADL